MGLVAWNKTYDDDDDDDSIISMAQSVTVVTHTYETCTRKLSQETCTKQNAALFGKSFWYQNDMNKQVTKAQQADHTCRVTVISS